MQRDAGKARHRQRGGEVGAEVIQLEQRKDHRLEQQRHQHQRDHRQYRTDHHRDPRQRLGERHQLLPALPLTDGLANHDGGGGAQTEAHHEEQAVQVAHDGVGRQEFHGDGHMAENHRQQAVAKTPEQLVAHDGGGVLDEPAQHLPARTQQRLQIQRDDLAAQGAEQAHGELRHAAEQRGQRRALHTQHGEAAFAEDQQVVQTGVQHRGHTEQLHAEASVLHAALGADIDGREHIEHIGKADEPQVRRAQQGQVVLVAEQIHDRDGPQEQHQRDEQRQHHAQTGRHADGAADVGQILLPPVLADEDAYAGLDAEDDGDQQKYRHVGSGHRRHLVVAQLADHEGVDKTQRERDEVLQGDGAGKSGQITVEAFIALQSLKHNSPQKIVIVYHSMGKRAA